MEPWASRSGREQTVAEAEGAGVTLSLHQGQRWGKAPLSKANFSLTAHSGPELQQRVACLELARHMEISLRAETGMCSARPLRPRLAPQKQLVALPPLSETNPEAAPPTDSSPPPPKRTLWESAPVTVGASVTGRQTGIGSASRH